MFRKKSKEEKEKTFEERTEARTAAPSSGRYLYFAYGSNLNIRQMMARCNTAVPVGAAELHGWALKFRRYLDIDESMGAITPGGLWACGVNDVLSLDGYEGYPNLYTRKPVLVNYYGRKVEAFVYTMTSKRKLDGLEAPTADYFRTCAKGYTQFGLDVSILTALAQDAEHAPKRHMAYDHFEGRNIMTGGF